MPRQPKRPSSKSAIKRPVDPAQISQARPGTQPEWLAPQLATLVKAAPDGDEWLHEIKFDGYRIQMVISDGTIRLLTRNANDWTDKYPTIVEAARAVPVRSAIIDGELVTIGDQGVSSFERMQNAGSGSRLVYYAFDLPWCDGFELTRSPLVERREFLRSLLSSFTPSDRIQFSDHVVGNGPTVFEHALRLGVEGIISKRASSPYGSKRGQNWLKVKCTRSQLFVIGGYSEPSGSRSGFGALLLGVYDNEANLVFCGRVGTGFTDALLISLLAEMTKHETPECPFTKNRPRGADARGVHWLKPKLVCEVEFMEWTSDGILRHPSFKGLRAAKNPRQVQREGLGPASPT